MLGVLFAAPISHWIGLGHQPWLVRAGAVGLWAQTNYQQLTALFRVEERSVAYAIASVANVVVTVAAMVVFVAVFHWGAVGLVVGNFTGTLVVYLALVAYRTEQLGLEFDRALFRRMQSFGMPLVPAALALWVINFVDREFVSWYKGNAEVGGYVGGGEDRLGDHLRADRVPHGVACVRLLDRGRPRGASHLLVRAHLPTRVRVMGGARTRGARSVVDCAAHRSELPPRREGHRPARLRGRRLRRVHGARDRERTRATHAAELGRDRRRRSRQRRPQLLAHSSLRDGRRRDLDARRLCRALRRHDALFAVRVPRRVSVATRRDRRFRGCRG